jgi:uroporphyrinogen decarboxylase
MALLDKKVESLNKRERVIKTLDIEEPDRVPIMEMDIEVPLMEAIIGKRYPVTTSLQTQVIANRGLEKKRNDFRIECYKKLDFDVITADLSAPEYWKPRINPDGKLIDLWGRILILDKQTKAWIPYGTLFNNPEDFDNFELPDPNASGWIFSTEYSREASGEGYALSTFIRDPFAQAWEMLTPINFVKWLYQKPNFIKKVMERITNFNIEIIKHIAEAKTDFIISGGDWCEKQGPMVPIKIFNEMIFPNLKKQVDTAHRYGLKFIKHTDGNINPLLEGVSNIVDGLHSLDPSAGVDIGEVKEKYGDKLVLIGNVAVDNLAINSQDEIAKETKEVIKTASPGGGHILSSSNSWASGSRLENCMIMVEIGRKYGKYPINI